MSTTDCPECSGPVGTDGSEKVCESCGLVVEEEKVDHGPEWRAFDDSERDEKSRVGSPQTHLIHDKGLSTNISWRDKDAYGNSLSSSQRQKVQRLRKWNERFSTKNTDERTRKYANGEIDRISSALGIPKQQREMIAVMFKRCQEEEDILPGRSIEGVVSACVYATCRQTQLPKTLDDIAGVSRIDRTEIFRTYQDVRRQLSLEIPPSDPKDHVNKLVSEIQDRYDFDQDTRIRIEDIVEETIGMYSEANMHSGKNPISIAASALYFAGLVIPRRKFTQEECAEIADVTEVTIRNRYHEMAELWKMRADDP